MLVSNLDGKVCRVLWSEKIGNKWFVEIQM